MALLTPYRRLPVERRIALLMHEITNNREAKSGYIQRLVARGGGFRPETVRKWPVEQLAREVSRRQLETLQDELGLLQLLYVELEPEIQIAFCDAAGVAHKNGLIDEATEPPFSDEAGVARAVTAVRAKFGEGCEHYLSTIALYNGDAWPGLAQRLEIRD